jgi:hypothetical protein
VSCLAHVPVLTRSEGENASQLRLWVPPIALQGWEPIGIRLVHLFAVERPRPRSRRATAVHTTKYIYDLVVGEDRELMSYHYHPEVDAAVGPHLHAYWSGDTFAGSLIADMHLATGRVSFEGIVRMLHRDFGVPYIRHEAQVEAMLLASEEQFNRTRAW